MTLQYVTQNVRGKAETIGHTTVTDETVAAWLDKKFNLAYVIATEIANKKGTQRGRSILYLHGDLTATNLRGGAKLHPANEIHHVPHVTLPRRNAEVDIIFTLSDNRRRKVTFRQGNPTKLR